MKGISVQVLNPLQVADFIKLLQIFEEEFDMSDFTPPSDTYLKKLLLNPKFKVIVAKDQNDVIGGLTMYILDVYYSQKQIGYIYDLAVSKPHQRKGVGKVLLKRAVSFGLVNEFELVFVQAETEEKEVLEFYRATPVTGELQATHFWYQLSPSADT